MQYVMLKPCRGPMPSIRITSYNVCYTKLLRFVGFYVTRESISRRKSSPNQGGSSARTYIALHLLTQPVILVAKDGRSSSIRTRLFQYMSSRTTAQGFSGGIVITSYSIHYTKLYETLVPKNMLAESAFSFSRSFLLRNLL